MLSSPFFGQWPPKKNNKIGKPIPVIMKCGFVMKNLPHFRNGFCSHHRHGDATASFNYLNRVMHAAFHIHLYIYFTMIDVVYFK